MFTISFHEVWPMERIKSPDLSAIPRRLNIIRPPPLKPHFGKINKKKKKKKKKQKQKNNDEIDQIYIFWERINLGSIV